LIAWLDAACKLFSVAGSDNGDEQRLQKALAPLVEDFLSDISESYDSVLQRALELAFTNAGWDRRRSRFRNLDGRALQRDLQHLRLSLLTQPRAPAAAEAALVATESKDNTNTTNKDNKDSASTADHRAPPPVKSVAKSATALAYERAKLQEREEKEKRHTQAAEEESRQRLKRAAQQAAAAAGISGDAMGAPFVLQAQRVQQAREELSAGVRQVSRT
jgi:hypothetical protein